MRKNLFVFTVCFLAVIISGGCKTNDQEYDIRGFWSITIQIPGSSTYTWSITFSGSETAGTANDTCFGTQGTGSYTVNNDQVSFEMTYASDFPFTVTYTGSFTDDSAMNGSLVFSHGETGAWTATR